MDEHNRNLGPGNQPPPGVSGQQHQQPPGMNSQNTGSQQNHHPAQTIPPQPTQTETIFAHLFQQQQAFAHQLMKQQQEFMQQQQQLFHQALQSIQVQVPPNPEMILDSLTNNIKEFRYEPEGNVTFAAWYARYDDLFEKDAARLDDEAKVRLLMRKLGAAEHDRYVSFILPKVPKNFPFGDTVKKLQTLFGAVEAVVSKRYRCLQIAKQPTEDYISFACRINKSCVEFELNKMTEEQFKCLMFVCGLKSEGDGEIRTRLLSKIEERTDVTLEQLSEDCQRLLCLKHDTAMIETSAPAVQFVKRKQFKKHPPKPGISGSDGTGTKQGKSVPASPCWNCGAMHFNRDCTYKQHECHDCGLVGHREGYCSSARKSPKSSAFKRKGRPGAVSTKTVSLLVNTVNKKRRFVQAQVNGVDVRLQLDTGSDISVVSKRIWEKVGKPPTMPAMERAATASGDPLKLLFKFICTVSINGVQRQAQFYVVEKSLQLLGIDMLDAFGLWSVPISAYCNRVASSATTVDSLKAAYPAVFQSELGLCTKTKIKLELNPEAVPAFRPKRPVAYAMYSAVDDELDRLERAKIISPVDFSDWAAPIVVVRKANGSIRICGDYSTGLNDALQPHRYPLPLPEDIFAKLANCTVFSQIDLSDAFLQVEVDEGSRDLLAINTHRGLYRYNRLPPGVKTAPGAFQQLIDTMLAGLPCTSGYLDDVVVGGKDAQEHWTNLRAVLERIQEFGFTIRPEKCTFAQPQIKYLGYLLDRNGLRPDPAKIQAITDMAPPTDVSGVRSFLGAVNYYGKFVPGMRTLRYPLDELLKAGTEFRWTPECQQAFTKFKALLSSDLLLAHYNPTLDIVVSADASSVGVGATISHKFPDGTMKVVQHASRALTPAERNYSQPDREGLAIIFAVTKFHRMLFGRRFHLQTDHAPLLRIFGSKKGIPVYTSNRLQRWALTLLLYDFTIEHVPTAKFGNADVLSRLISQHVRPDEDYVIASVALEDDIRSVTSDTLNILPLSFRIVQKATQSDPVTKKVYRFLHEGWPSSKQIPDPELKRFCDRQESLTTVQGCILFGERLVIPSSYRRRCLDQLHRGHPGIQRMKAIARSYVYWPSLDKEIADYVKSCRHCATAAKSPPKCAPVPWPRSSKPWERVHIDYAGPITGEYYLVVVNSYSKWPEIIQTRSTTSTATIGILKDVFARFGMPETLVSDNGPQFTSAEFQRFCAENGIDHLTIAPFHPQSNGQAERFVDTFKRSIKKIQEGRGTIREALNTFLITYRSTPNPSATDGKSPAEIMFGRPIRTCLELLRPPPDHSAAHNQPTSTVKRGYQRDDLVFAKLYVNNNWHWAPGVVLEKVGTVMYNVWVDNRKLVRSQINQLKDRAAADHHSKAATQDRKKLPINILLDAWDLPEPRSQIASPGPLPIGSLGNPPSLLSSTPNSLIHAPVVSPVLPSSSASSSTSSQVSASPAGSVTSDFQSATEQEPAVQVPRRTTRVRRAPQRYQPYLLY